MYWINKNSQNIALSSLKFKQKYFNEKSIGDGYTPDAFPVYDAAEGTLSYVYITHSLWDSSWSNTQSSTEEHVYNRKDLMSIVRFHIALMVPKIKGNHCQKMAELVIKEMKSSHYKYVMAYYDSYQYEQKSINIELMYTIIETYLKTNKIYRLKTEFHQSKI